MDRTITQVDAACWARLREVIQIPEKIPSLPIISLHSHKRKSPPLITEKPIKAQRVITMEDEEQDTIKVVKIVTPPKRTKSIPAPRKSVNKKALTPYVPTLLKDLQRQKLMQRISCKRSQRNELRKITAAMDIELAEMSKELTALEHLG